MTHHIQHQYDELVSVALPNYQIHVQYFCKSEITIDDEGEHEPVLISFRVEVNGMSSDIDATPFPLESHGKEAREFLALLRESARQALWAKALEAAKEAGYRVSTGLFEAAERWQRTGSAKLQMPFPIEKPEPFYG